MCIIDSVNNLVTQAQNTVTRLELKLDKVLKARKKIHPRMTTSVAAAEGRIQYLVRLLDLARARLARRKEKANV